MKNALLQLISGMTLAVGVFALGIAAAQMGGDPMTPSPTSLPTATITATPKPLPRATITRSLPQATKTITSTPRSLPKASTTRITEDDPRWNCHTMGNKRCGKVVAPRKNMVAQGKDHNLPHAGGACKGISKDLIRVCEAKRKTAPLKSVFEDGSQAWVPNGEVLVRECRAQYSGRELRICLAP